MRSLHSLRSLLRPAIISLALLAIFTILTGVLYPLFITGVAQAVFPHQANGSLIVHDKQIVGSQLIGQQFTDPSHFWGRPSATVPYPYNSASSSGSNLGLTNPAIAEEVNTRIEALQAADPSNNLPVPIDLVTSSGSGLDPDISVAAALYQVSRVVKARGLNEDVVRALVDQYTQGRQFSLLGEPRVNVLELNLALDEIK